MMHFVSGSSGCRTGFRAVVAALALSVMASATGFAADHPSLQVIVDASASMEDQLAGELKYKLVRRVAQTVLPRYDGRVDMGLIAYGYGSKDSCQDASSLAPLKMANAKNVLLALDAAKPRGMSPIAAALNLAAPAGGARPSEILVIADGGDNCGGNVCSIASSLAAAEPRTRVHVIGLGETGSLRSLSCLAEATKGTFTLVGSQAAFESAVDRVLLTSLTPPVAEMPAAAVADPAPAEPKTVTFDEPPPLPARRPQRETAPKQAEQLAPAKDETRAVAAAGEHPASPEREEIEIKVVPTPADQASAAAETTPVPEMRPALTAEPDEKSAPLSGQELAAIPSPLEEEVTASPPSAEEPEAVPGAGMSGMTGDAGFVGKEPDLNTAIGENETRVRLMAFITEGGEQIRSGLIWRIYKAKRNDNGHFELLKSGEEPRFDTSLPIGSYLVNLSWGRAHLTEKLDVLSSKPMAESMILNAGGLRLAAQDSESRPMPARQVQWRIYAEERDQFGNRQLLIDKAPGGKIIRLNAGIYHVESVLGTANGVIEADLTVQAGKLTDAIVTHTATLVTFKLVNAPGGEALAGAMWRILSPDGTLIKETGGALPSQILAAGDYQVEAQYSGRTFARKVTIEPGDPVHVEIVIQ